MKILVSGASGVMGYGILKTLKGLGHKLIGTTIYNFSVAPCFCDEVEIVLPTNHPNYISDLNRIIKKHNIDMIIPGIEDDVYKWNNEKESLLTYPLLNNKSLIELCFNKWLFYQKLSKVLSKYAIPTSISDIPLYPFPFLLKPIHGYGSKGIEKVEDEDGFSYHHNRGIIHIQQPIIGSNNEEYTVSGFFDSESNLIDYFPLRRKLSSGGFTGEAIVEDRNFKEVLVDLAKVFNPIGPTNFQFRFDHDIPKLLEINPRISAATSIRAAMGYNEAGMSINYFLNNKLPEIKDKPIGRKAIRYTEDLIF